MNTNNKSDLSSILEKLHEKSLMSEIFNDQKVHVMPSHANGDGCISEAHFQIEALFMEVIGKDAIIDKRTTEESQYLVRFENRIKAEQRSNFNKRLGRK